MSMDINGESGTTLVPIGDLIRHLNPVNANTYFQYSIIDNAVQFKTIDAIKRGEEVSFCYGPIENNNLFLNFGHLYNNHKPNYGV